MLVVHMLNAGKMGRDLNKGQIITARRLAQSISQSVYLRMASTWWEWSEEGKTSIRKQGVEWLRLVNAWCKWRPAAYEAMQLWIHRCSTGSQLSTWRNRKWNPSDQATFFHRSKVQSWRLCAHCRHFRQDTGANLWLHTPIRNRAWCTVMWHTIPLIIKMICPLCHNSWLVPDVISFTFRINESWLPNTLSVIHGFYLHWPHSHQLTISSPHHFPFHKSSDPVV